MALYDYFKDLESKTEATLPPKGWYVIRIDGKKFSTYTSGLNKPFHSSLSDAFVNTAKFLCENLQNVKMAYTQSDEISLILTDMDQINTSLLLGGDVQKIVSITASMATAIFNKTFTHPVTANLAFFDSRAFKLKDEGDVIHYLRHRQRDAIKNAITMISLKYYSPKQLHQKNSDDKKEMIKSKGDSFEYYHKGLTQGFLITKQSKKIATIDRATGKSVTVDRTSWKASESPDFESLESMQAYYSLRKA